MCCWHLLFLNCFHFQGPRAIQLGPALSGSYAKPCVLTAISASSISLLSSEPHYVLCCLGIPPAISLGLHRHWPHACSLPRTAAWQAPEVLDDEVNDWYSADAYSFAVVLFELQTAKVLLPGSCANSSEL